MRYTFTSMFDTQVYMTSLRSGIEILSPTLQDLYGTCNVETNKSIHMLLNDNHEEPSLLGIASLIRGGDSHYRLRCGSSVPPLAPRQSHVQSCIPADSDACSLIEIYCLGVYF